MYKKVKQTTTLQQPLKKAQIAQKIALKSKNRLLR